MGEIKFYADQIQLPTKNFIESCFELLPGQALHAKTLGFIHPETKAKMAFSSALNEGMETLIQRWEGYTMEN